MLPDVVGLADAGLAADGLRGVWAYVTLAATAFWGSELAPLLAGFAAMQGHLVFPSVVVAVGVGVWTVMTGLYFLGRWRADWVQLRTQSAPPMVRRILFILRTNPWRSAVLARFVFGGRILLPLSCGAAQVPVWIFLTGSAIASAAWAAAFASLGWFFGEGALAIYGQMQRFEEVVAAVVIAAGFLAVFVMVRRRQKRAGAANEPTVG